MITDKHNVLMHAAARQDVSLRWVSPSQCMFDVSSVPTYFGMYHFDTYLSQYLKDFGRNEVYSCDWRLGSPTIRLTPIGYRAGKESDFSELGNRIFPERRQILDKNSVLRLNKEISSNDKWDVNEIYARADRLIADVCKIWPSLDVFREENS